MTIVVLLTRDLRVHDHPALCAAVEEGDPVVPLFVFDDAAHATPLAAPNKVAFLLDAVADLTSSCRDLGGALVKRRGVLSDEVAALVEETGAEAVFLAEDASAFASAGSRACVTGWARASRCAPSPASSCTAPASC